MKLQSNWHFSKGEEKVQCTSGCILESFIPFRSERLSWNTFFFIFRYDVHSAKYKQTCLTGVCERLPFKQYIRVSTKGFLVWPREKCKISKGIFGKYVCSKQECSLNPRPPSWDLTFILRRSFTGTVWFYTSTSNKRAARPKLYTKSLTRDLKRMYSRLTLVRISINL